MAREDHSARRTALAEYQELFLRRIMDDVSYEEFDQARRVLLADKALGITGRMLDAAEEKALKQRKKQLAGQ